MPVFVSNLTKYGEKSLSLITIDGVKDLTARGISYQCNYDLVGFTEDGKPQYRCIYMPSDDPDWFVLVATRVGKHGPDVRLFNIWPGLFKHHHEFGDGRSLCFNNKFGLSLLRQSILKDAFAGKLVPQDPTDEPASARIAAEKPVVKKTRRKKTV